MSDLRMLLTELIAIASPSGQEAELASWCERYLQAHGFHTRRQYIDTQRFNLLAHKGSGPALLLYAHLDTVPAADDWCHDPLRLQAQGDQLTGLGASDMKGGLAVLLQAAAQAAPQNYSLKIALGVDEEVWSAGAWALVQQERDWLQDIALVLVPEIAVDSQQLTLGLGRRGCLQFEMGLKGPAQHAAVAAESTASAGPSTLELASQLILQSRDYPFFRQQGSASEGLTWLGVQSQRKGLSAPGQCQLQLAYFALPDHSPAEITAELAAFFSARSSDLKLQLMPRPTPLPLAYAAEADDPLVTWVQDCCQQVLGQSLPTALGWSVADENILAAALNVPVLSLAPVGGRSHQSGEWVSQQSLEQLEQIYQQILAQAGQILLR